MRKPRDPIAEYAKDLLHKTAAECGWRIMEDTAENIFDWAYARVWVTDHVGIQVESKGRTDQSSYKLIIKTCVTDGERYKDQARNWRKLCGIEQEDRQTILELAAKFPQKEALISGAELRRYEDSLLYKHQREALAARAATFKERTGQELWVNAYGPPEAKDEPFTPGYERPTGWLKSLTIKPGSATFTVEVPDEGENLEGFFCALRLLERQAQPLLRRLPLNIQ